MAEGAGDGSGGATGVPPGALTALLAEVAAAPEQREAEPPPLLPGTVIGRFEILRELGRGGFGVVYEARDRDLGRQVAVKVVRPGRIAEEEGKVSREAEAIARLTHPNLITLYDVGRCDGGPYLVFEFLRGKTLQERMDEGPMPVQEAVHVATEVARGLAHAHAEGVVHRDLKPSNVFVTTKGQVKILDFGMAHAFGRRRLSGGTPAYMAPEQWEDEPEDERADVFALGVMLYRMLAGEYPFPEGEGRWAAEARTLRKLDVPGAPGLADLVDQMLDRAAKARPRDGAALLAALTPIEHRLRAKPLDGSPPVQDDLVALIDRLSDRTRQELRETPAEVAGARVELGRALTHSLEAYQHYLRARDTRLRNCDYVAAAAEARRALELDPEMGAAHMELAANLLWLGGDAEESRRHFQLSRDRTAGLPDKERRIVEIDTFVTNSVPVPGDRELQRQTVMRKLDELLARYPQDEYVTYFAGHAHYSFGEWEKALGLFRRSLDIDPGQCHVVGFASVTLNRLGREGEKLAMLQRAVEARPNAGNRAMLGVEMAGKPPEEASRHAREALRLVRPGQTGVVSNASCALASAGFPEEAARAVQGIGEDDEWGATRASVRRLLPVLLALQGRPGEAARSFDHARGVQQGNALLSPRASLLAVGRTGNRAPLSVAEIRRGPDFLLKAGELALFGDLHGAAQTAASLTLGSPPEVHYRAVRAAVEHRWVDAIPALRPLLDAWKEAPPGGVPDPRWAYRLEARLLLGEALLETGSTAEALEVLQAADRFGLCGVQQAAHVPNILVLRARAYEKLGRSAEALKDLDRLLGLWKNAEPGLPLHAEAKAMRERLAGPAR